MLSSKEIRRSFTDFFETNHGHTYVPSSNLILKDDPTLMFTNSGMVQFKDLFLGAGTRDYKRAVNSQKCVRVSGKHNDLEEVGRDTYHHTFFEMLGNWSFNGSYGKEEAIQWAWQLLTEIWGVDKSRLHATVFGGDDQMRIPADNEAFELWTDATDIEPNHVHYFGAKDNFWQMGDVGPCGPCSEIHIDLTDDRTGRDKVNRNDPEVMEIWNLVFMQYQLASDGSIAALPNRHIDTGMGIERVTAILQRKASNYDTDVFAPVINTIASAAGKRYGENSINYEDIAIRVIADHLRFLVFVLSDGGVPGSKDRGSVIRRILRRAVRFGYQYLDFKEPFLHLLTGSVVDQMGDVYPELTRDSEGVDGTIYEEEEDFFRTIKRGMSLFRQVANNAVGDGGKIGGKDVFDLHTTHGFPPDIVQQMAQEQGLQLELDDYERRIKKHEAISRGNVESIDKRSPRVDLQRTDDRLKWETRAANALINGWMRDDIFYDSGTLTAGDHVAIVADKSCFYARAGGQVGDQGRISTGSGSFRVTDTEKWGDTVLHHGFTESGEIQAGEVAAFNVSPQRDETKKNHTGTHLLNWALTETLGDHVQQRGSKVTPDVLTFDFPNDGPMSSNECTRVEELVNKRIQENIVVTSRELPVAEARKLDGVRAEFGERYGETVRVVEIGNLSREFCCGTHVDHTGEIGLFKIVRQDSAAKGIRRITCVTGLAGLRHVQQQADIIQRCSTELKCASSDIPVRVRQLLTSQPASGSGDCVSIDQKLETQGLLKNSRCFGELSLVVGQVRHQSSKLARLRLDEIRDHIGSGVVALASTSRDRVNVRIAVTDDVADLGLEAVALAKTVGELLGNGGGSRVFAEAGGKNVASLDAALRAIENHAAQQLAVFYKSTKLPISQSERTEAMITYDDFAKVDIRVGRVVNVEEFPRARKPAYRVDIEFGADVGTKQSSVQATNYSKDELLGMQVVAVVNFEPKNIAGFMSEVLILGAPGDDGQPSLLTPSRPAQVGEKVY